MNQKLIFIVTLVIVLFVVYVFLKWVFGIVREIFEGLPELFKKILILVAVIASIYVLSTNPNRVASIIDSVLNKNDTRKPLDWDQGNTLPL